MTDNTATATVPSAGAPQVAAPEAVVPPPPGIGQNIEQSLNKLGQAAHDAARDLGAAAGKAADQAAAKITPMTEQASKSLDATARDLEIAASTVKQGCAEVAGSAWNALSAGNFGQMGDAIKATAGTCADSLGASLMALTPWMN
jgi:hypothetical protein